MFGAGPEPEPGSWGAREGPAPARDSDPGGVPADARCGLSRNSRNGLVLRLLFETAVQVSELSRLDAPDIELAERTPGIRHGKGAKDRLALFIRQTSSSCCRCTSGVGHTAPSSSPTRARGSLSAGSRALSGAWRRRRGLSTSGFRRARYATRGRPSPVTRADPLIPPSYCWVMRPRGRRSRAIACLWQGRARRMSAPCGSWGPRHWAWSAREGSVSFDVGL
jgi:hypothetical protein